MTVIKLNAYNYTEEYDQILIDNIFVQIGVGGRVFQQTIGIPMGTNNAYLVRSIPHTGASQGNQKRS
jgi:hypothetical protein